MLASLLFHFIFYIKSTLHAFELSCGVGGGGSGGTDRGGISQILWPLHSMLPLNSEPSIALFNLFERIV